MEVLEVLLARHGITNTVRFDPQHSHVQCYAHIINICSSHIISSFTSTPESYISQLKITPDPNYLCHCTDSLDARNKSDSDSGTELGNLDNNDNDDNDQDYELKLASCHRQGNPKPKGWVDTMKCNPLWRAQRVIHLLCSSDNHRTEFQKIIINGNEHGFFTKMDSSGNQVKDDIPVLQVLRDIRTRWDLVYLMLLHLREL